MSWNLIKLFLIAFCFTKISSLKDDIPRIQTPYGGLRGSYKTSLNGRTYKSFTGIPFALPPIGNLRFEPPVPVKPWNNELDASKDSKVCLQYISAIKYFVGVEDCLYLNIYVPDVKNTTLLPVIFWIYGGGFKTGSNMLYRPTYFMDKDVIVVMPNYRLDAFGFLSTGDNVVPGNMALKDQSMALRWVYENIRYFGGDQKRITLLGNSAGASCLHYHYFSPMSAGLFQNGISTSGTAFNRWARSKNPADNAKWLANNFNCSTNSSLEIVRCLKNQQPFDILRASQMLATRLNILRNFVSPFRPVIENSTSGYFINQTPEELLKEGKANDVPWITGAVSEEGITSSRPFILDEDKLRDIDNNWDYAAPLLLDLHNNFPEDEAVEIARLARRHYFGDAPFEMNDSTYKKFFHMTGDCGVAYDAQRAAVLQAQYSKSPVQIYFYTYRANQSLSHLYLNSKKNYGVCHSDDILMVLEMMSLIDPTATPNDIIVMELLLQMWYTYSEKGRIDVGISWPKVYPYSEYLQYLRIAGPNDMTVKITDNYGEKKFWKKMFKNQNIE